VLLQLFATHASALLCELNNSGVTCTGLLSLAKPEVHLDPAAVLLLLSWVFLSLRHVCCLCRGPRCRWLRCCCHKAAVRCNSGPGRPTQGQCCQQRELEQKQQQQQQRRRCSECGDRAAYAGYNWGVGGVAIKGHTGLWIRLLDRLADEQTPLCYQPDA
jgi:hypothetical protein